MYEDYERFDNTVENREHKQQDRDPLPEVSGKLGAR